MGPEPMIRIFLMSSRRGTDCVPAESEIGNLTCVDPRVPGIRSADFHRPETDRKIGEQASVAVNRAKFGEG